MLLLALVGDDAAYDQARTLPRDLLRWDVLVAASRLTRVTAYLEGLVAATGFEVGQVAAALREETERVAAQAALTVHTAGRAQACLQAAGVQSLAVKGAAFQAHAPAHLARRHLDDVDLLVRARDLAPAAAALTAGGFEPDDLLPDYGGLALDGAAGQPGLHRTANFLGPGRTLVEVHTAMPASLGPEATFDALLARAVTIHHGGAVLTVPGLDDTLGLLCRHVMVQHAAEADHLPRHVADVAALLRAGARADVAAARFDADGRGAVASSLALLEAARQGTGRAARAWSPAWGPLDRLRVRLQEYGAAARASPLEMLLPARRYMAQRYGVPAGSPLLPLLYLWRPLRGVVKLLLGR